jgi:septum formation protein
LGLEARVITSDADEIGAGTPEEMVVANACIKRDDVAGQVNEPAIVIAADTLVFLDGDPLGKPGDLDEARAMLTRLSGATHEVVTGVAIVHTGTGETVEGHETTGVTFRALSEPEIDAFVIAVKPLDRAGAYTVDGPGSLLVQSYAGCFYNVLGLPIIRLDSLLRTLGLSLFDYMNKDKAVFL